MWGQAGAGYPARPIFPLAQTIQLFIENNKAANDWSRFSEPDQ